MLSTILTKRIVTDDLDPLPRDSTVRSESLFVQQRWFARGSSSRVAGHFADPRPRSSKARKLVEHFGSAEAVFRASLTELEETGIQGRFRPIASHREVGGTGAGRDRPGRLRQA